MESLQYTILKTPDYFEWFCTQPLKDRVQIEERLLHIQSDGHFGTYKSVDENDEVWELKWVGGRRIYYAYIPPKRILLLLGGNKNGQDKDIKKAKKIYRKSVEIED